MQPPKENITKDRLNKIFSLGLTSQDRLYAAGIYTFKHLINTPTAELHRITRMDAHIIKRWKKDAIMYANGTWT